MSDNIEYPKTPGKGKVFAGLILLAVGIVFLFQQLDFFFFPHWLFRWPIWLIIWALYIGAKHDFRNSSWLIMLLIGVGFLLDGALPDYNVSAIIWPIAIIIFGLWLILRRNHNFNQHDWGKKWENKWNNRQYGYGVGTPFEPVVTPVTPVGADSADPSSATDPTTGTSTGPNPNAFRGDDYLDAVSVFGGVNKTILSKNFKGGEIVNIFGGAELDFTQADIQGRVVIDITQIFGGTKIIVPSNWQVVSDLAAVFASVDDKRIKSTATQESTKILVLKGVSIFAGVDVRSY